MSKLKELFERIKNGPYLIEDGKDYKNKFMVEIDLILDLLTKLEKVLENDNHQALTIYKNFLNELKDKLKSASENELAAKLKEILEDKEYVQSIFDKQEALLQSLKLLKNKQLEGETFDNILICEIAGMFRFFINEIEVMTMFEPGQFFGRLKTNLLERVNDSNFVRNYISSNNSPIETFDTELIASDVNIPAITQLKKILSLIEADNNKKQFFYYLNNSAYEHVKSEVNNIEHVFQELSKYIFEDNIELAISLYKEQSFNIKLFLLNLDRITYKETIGLMPSGKPALAYTYQPRELYEQDQRKLQKFRQQNFNNYKNSDLFKAFDSFLEQLASSSNNKEFKAVIANDKFNARSYNKYGNLLTGDYDFVKVYSNSRSFLKMFSMREGRHQAAKEIDDLLVAHRKKLDLESKNALVTKLKEVRRGIVAESEKSPYKLGPSSLFKQSTRLLEELEVKDIEKYNFDDKKGSYLKPSQ